MKNSKIIARTSTFIKFFTKALSDNNEIEIKNWVREHLIDKNPEADGETKIGFFEAEKELIRVYLSKGSINEIQKLVAVFDDFDDTGLRRLEFNILTSVLKEKKDILTSHPEYYSSLKETLNNTFDKLIDKNDSDLARFNEIQTLLGEEAAGTPTT